MPAAMAKVIQPDRVVGRHHRVAGASWSGAGGLPATTDPGRAGGGAGGTSGAPGSVRSRISVLVMADMFGTGPGHRL